MISAAHQLGDAIRAILRRGPHAARELAGALQVSQPTISRALATLGEDLVTMGAARSIQYALRDISRSDLTAPIYRVTSGGQLSELGLLIPVYPEGFVMVESGGNRLHSEGLPWWLYDMRPQGFLGRVYNLRHGERLGLPPRLSDWQDKHVLRAMILQGGDLPGNLLVGDAARDHFINAEAAIPIEEANKARAYAELAAAAERGELPGSSAGGEQPKFTTYAEDQYGSAHFIVKFSVQEDHEISRRWRDLLQAEHLALQLLNELGTPAAPSAIYNQGTQRFLEVRRFDREGALGRRALYSIAALDAEFVGSGGSWPHIARRLEQARVIISEAIARTDLLWAFGSLIGNTDMHGGNLSFMSEGGRPYELAPAYDMTPMAFAPTTGGVLPDQVPVLSIGNDVSSATWHQALPMAMEYLHRLEICNEFSEGFSSCIVNLRAHIENAAGKIARLA